MDPVNAASDSQQSGYLQSSLFSKFESDRGTVSPHLIPRPNQVSSSRRTGRHDSCDAQTQEAVLDKGGTIWDMFPKICLAITHNQSSLRSPSYCALSYAFFSGTVSPAMCCQRSRARFMFGWLPKSSFC